MPALAEHRQCPCGARHDLYFPDGPMLEVWREYEYECPATGQTVRFVEGPIYNKVAPAPPPGAVILREVQ